jgi:hypothetical protein
MPTRARSGHAEGLGERIESTDCILMGQGGSSSRPILSTSVEELPPVPDVEAARARATISYGEMTRGLGIAAQGPLKPVLHMLAHKEINAGCHDMTHLLVNGKTGISSYFGWTQTATPPTYEQKKEWEKEVAKIWPFYFEA